MWAQPGATPGHHGIHVAVQGRKGQPDLLGLVPGDAPSASWELPCTLVSPPPAADLRGPYVQGSPGKRFVYLSWGVLDGEGTFTMFRRAKLRLDLVADDVMATAVDLGVLVGRVGLTDHKGNPRCASVGPSDITWSAAAS